MPSLPQPFWRRVLEVRDVLAFSFDFDLFEQPLGADAYATPAPWLPAVVVPDAIVSFVARDATGGVYVCCERGRERCYLHVDTRGHAVYLGVDVQEVLALIVELPYWPELLAQCPSGELAALREHVPGLEEEAREDLYQLPAARQELKEFLELPALDDPVLRLYELAVLTPAPVALYSPHGWRYESPIRVRGQHHPPHDAAS
jgi:hypothetical protein